MVLAYAIAHRDSSFAHPMLARPSPPSLRLLTFLRCIAAVVFIAIGDDLMYATSLSRHGYSQRETT